MDEQNTKILKSKAKNKKFFVLLVINFFSALFSNILSVFVVYKPDTYCHPPECLGEIAFSYYGYPLKYLQFKPSGFDFYLDKFLYNFIIYFFIVFVVIFLYNLYRKNKK